MNQDPRKQFGEEVRQAIAEVERVLGEIERYRQEHGLTREDNLAFLESRMSKEDVAQVYAEFHADLHEIERKTDSREAAASAGASDLRLHGNMA
jgi:hypothetical protein